MDDKQISINTIKVEFDVENAFLGILSNLHIKAPHELKGLCHPSEVLKVAQDAIINAFKSIIEDMSDVNIQNHLRAHLIVTSGLNDLIDPKFKNVEQREDLN